MIKTPISVLLVSLLLIPTIFAEDKLAQTGFQFLSVTSDARGAAMAGAMTTLPTQSSALYFNPAGLALMDKAVDITASQNQWIADIMHNAISVAIQPMGGRVGVIGFSALSVNYGDIQGASVWPIEAGGIETHIIQPSAITLGAGYAYRLSNRFSVGLQIKYAAQQLGKSVIEIDDSLSVKKNMTEATAYDFGTHFDTGYKGIAFGMSIRNFSNEIAYEEENFQLPLTFTMGLSTDLTNFMPQFSDQHAMLLSVDAVHPRSYPEHFNIGLEYTFMDLLSLRTGYLHSRDERDMTFGFGLEYFGIVLDYAYIPFGIFNDVQVITARFSY
ncbi:MAG: PorV/PorQ family protein [Candidatus Marinimicrobia bacterium]|nr:PorV/PorQ family protein [Candidatus Neomarinimicrobiota bacterium]